MNTTKRMERMKQWAHVQRAVIRADDADFVAWTDLLPNRLRRQTSSGERLQMFRVYLRVHPDALRDWWRFAEYSSRNPGARFPTRKWPNGKYPITDVEGFIRFLQNEPGRFFGKAAAAVAGFAIAGPVGAAVAAGAAKGGQEYRENDRTFLEGVALGGIGGYGAALTVAAPLLNITTPGAGTAAGNIGAGLIAKTEPKPEQEAPQMPEKYRRLLQALIAVESGGDSGAISPSGTYVGLLQMGPDAAADVGIADHKATLLGNADAAIRAFWKYQKRYVSRTGGHPFLMALLWKGGPGTVSKFRSKLDAGASAMQALRESAPASWNVVEYIRRVAKAY